MKTAVLALAVFWHSVLTGSAWVQPVVSSVNGEAKAGRGLEETIAMLPPFVELDEEGFLECDSFGLGTWSWVCRRLLRWKCIL